MNNISNKIKGFKIESTISEFKSLINKHTTIHNKQINFAEVLLDDIYNSTENKVKVASARCGIGKSVFIKSFLSNLVNQNFYIGKVNRRDILERYGAIVITDSLERLHDIANYGEIKDRCYLMQYDKEDIESNNRIKFNKQLQEQYRYPILLITTQKYFKMSESERKALYKWKKGNEKCNREITLIDEKPILINSITIDEDYFNDIRAALHRVYESDEKNYLLDGFSTIYNNLDSIRKKYSELYEKMWLKSDKSSLLINNEEDEKFFDILADNVSSNIYEKVENLKRIYLEGCLFVSNKNKEQENIRQFILLESNEGKFDLDKTRYYILDATAKNDIEYLIDKNKFEFVNIDDKKEVKDITINHITFGSSQNRLKDIDNINIISKWINNNFKDVLVATYSNKRGILGNFNKCLNTDNIIYFGNIKGKNNWDNLNNIVQVGFNRQSDVVYLSIYIELYKKKSKWNKMDNKDIESEIDSIINLEKGFFTDNKMNDIMRSKILVDTEQNIMRIKCRHFSNKEKCNIYIVANESYKGYIQRLQDKLNTDYKRYLPLEFSKYITDNRKADSGKKKTNPQIISEWIDNNKGRGEVKMAVIIEETGLSDNQIKSARKKNKYIKSWFNDNLGSKRGYYIV